MCVIARYEIMKFRRGKSRDILILSETAVEKILDQGCEEYSTRIKTLEFLQTCIDSLKEEEKTLIKIAYNSNTSIKAFAKTLNKSAHATYQKLQRIRNKLADCWNLSLAPKKYEKEDKRLIQAYYSGSITKRDAKKLSELLEHDPKARSYYITYSAITEHLGESIEDAENEIFSSPQLSFYNKQSTAPWLLIAASLVLAFFVFDYLKNRDNDQTVVAISEPASVLNNSRNQAQLVDHFNASIKGITRRLEDFIWVLANTIY